VIERQDTVPDTRGADAIGDSQRDFTRAREEIGSSVPDRRSGSFSTN
jgi:hypothetical protein